MVIKIYLLYIIYIKVEGFKSTSLTEFKKHLDNALRQSLNFCGLV